VHAAILPWCHIFTRSQRASFPGALRGLLSLLKLAVPPPVCQSSFGSPARTRFDPYSPKGPLPSSLSPDPVQHFSGFRRLRTSVPLSFMIQTFVPSDLVSGLNPIDGGFPFCWRCCSPPLSRRELVSFPSVIWPSSFEPPSPAFKSFSQFPLLPFPLVRSFIFFQGDLSLPARKIRSSAIASAGFRFLSLRVHYFFVQVSET